MTVRKTHKKFKKSTSSKDMKNKEGMSGIIATVLIILLGFSAVVILWNFVQPVLFSQGQNIDLNQKCLEAEVEPVGCSYCYFYSQTPFITTAIIKQIQGDVSEVTGFVEINPDKIEQKNVTAPGPLSTVTISDFAFENAPTKLKASPVVSTADGSKKLICEQSTKEVTCIYLGDC